MFGYCMDVNMSEKDDIRWGETKEHPTKKEEFENFLRNLEVSADDILGLAVVTKTGLPIAARLPRDVDVETFSGMSAATYSSAETAMMELRHGHVSLVYTEMEDYTLLIVDAGAPALIVGLTRSGSNTGLAIMRLKSAAGNVEELMK